MGHREYRVPHLPYSPELEEVERAIGRWIAAHNSGHVKHGTWMATMHLMIEGQAPDHDWEVRLPSGTIMLSGKVE